MRAVADQQQSAGGVGVPARGQRQFTQDELLLARRMLVVAPDDDQVVGLAQLGVPRPGVDQRREALDVVQAPDREDQRAPVTDGREQPDPVDQILHGGRAAGAVDRGDRDAFGHRSHPLARGVRGQPDQCLQLRPPARTRQQREAMGAVAHVLDQPGAEDQVLGRVGLHEGRAVELAARLAAVDHAMRVGRQGEVHGQAEPPADALGGQRRDVGEAQVHRVDRREPSERRLQGVLELASVRPQIGRREVARHRRTGCARWPPAR